MLKVRTAHDDDYNSDDFGISFPEPTLTKQSFKDDCDINNIVGRYLKSGVISTSINPIPAIFADVSNIPDYQASLNIVLEAQKSFDALPANVRERFANNPAFLLDFLSHPENTDEAIKLGLAIKRSEAVAAQPQELSAAAASGTPTASPAASPAQSSGVSSPVSPPV